MRNECAAPKSNAAMLLEAVLVWNALLVTCWYFAPKAIELFKDMDLRLSLPGLLFLRLCELFSSYNTPVYPALLMLAIPLTLVLKDHLIRSPQVQLRTNSLIGKTLAVVLAAGILSLAVPLLISWVRFCITGQV